MGKLLIPLSYLTASITILAFGFTIRSNADLWWHIAAGRDILLHHTLRMTDTWSYTTSGAYWLNHEWLADIIYALWTDLFSLESLVFWKWGILLCTYLLIFHTLTKIHSSRMLCLVGLFFTLFLSGPYLDFRPQLYSLCFLSILLFLCYSGRIWTLFSPLLFLVWANIHAGALLGAIVHFSFFINDRQATPARRITFFALSGIALLCNPSGLSLVTYPLQYAFSSNGDFSLLREWQSPLVSYSFQELAILLAPLFLGLIACILAFVRSKNRTEAFLFLLTFAMGMKSERFIPFAAMFLPFILLSVLPESEKRLSVRIEALLSFILLGCASLYTFSFPFHPSAFAYMVRQEKIPVVMCQFLREQNLNGNVFARYALAAHIPYCTNGNLKVFIDGRADTIYPPEIFSLYRSIYNLTPGWEKQLNDSHTDYVLWTKKGAFLSALQQSTDWELLFEDHISYLFRRKGAYPNLSPFTPTGPYAALSRAIAMSSKHLYKKAEEALLSAASEHFPAPEICRTHAKLIAYQNRFEEAYEKLQECQKLYPYPSRLQLLEETEKRLRKYEPWYGRVDFPSITLY